MEINNLVGTLINALYGLINFLIDGVCLILPSWSITDMLSGAFAEFGPFLGAVNYFVPFGTMIEITAAWVAAVVIWYIVQFVLRFVQLGS